jgi:ABC-2 type transport system ATP-binding protein
MSIEVNNLVKEFGTQKAVNNISFAAQSGSILGFLGPNGAGKSTTMKMATCFVPPTSGTIKVCGFDVTENAMEVKKNVGYLPEHNPLYLDMYVKEYLHFIGSLHQIKSSTLNARVKEMIERTGLGVEQNKKIGALSKGYRQRVGLAQALIHDPKVLILDEPTTGLDPNQIVEIRSLIREVGKEKTVVFSTHIMQEVQQLCDRVIIINKGSIVADQPIANLQNMVAKQTIIIAEFEKEIDIVILNAIEGVTDVITLGNSKYQINTSQTNDVRSAIFKIASENSLPLVGLKQEEISLESIFRELTK